MVTKSYEELNENRKYQINNRYEATQTINPITGRKYGPVVEKDKIYVFEEDKVPGNYIGDRNVIIRVEDPIDSKLLGMEEELPSSSYNRKNTLEKTLGDEIRKRIERGELSTKKRRVQ